MLLSSAVRQLAIIHTYGAESIVLRRVDEGNQGSRRIDIEESCVSENSILLSSVAGVPRRFSVTCTQRATHPIDNTNRSQDISDRRTNSKCHLRNGRCACRDGTYLL